ncbi:VOC family protein [Patescibacteria group bacterium]|nr:VOC family protein [Patescibacteria group bacterium]
MIKTKGLHHITAITSDPQANVDFYEGFLGQRFIKRTVNFDDPSAYHLYYGDAVGTPGTALTFFYWAGIPDGTRGSGEVDSIYYAIPPGSIEYWKQRAETFLVIQEEKQLPFGETCLMIKDPDGPKIGLVEATVDDAVQHWADGPIPHEHSLRGFYGTLLNLPEGGSITPLLTVGLVYSEVATKDGVTRYEATSWPGKFLATKPCPDMPRATQGAGSIHHIAFQAETDAELMALGKQVQNLGVATTGLIDRQYFHSVYFMTPASILFEIATDDIGFTIDEPADELGEHLMIPRQYEHLRTSIEAHLTPLSLPRHKK